MAIGRHRDFQKSDPQGHKEMVFMKNKLKWLFVGTALCSMIACGDDKDDNTDPPAEQKLKIMGTFREHPAQIHAGTDAPQFANLQIAIVNPGALLLNTATAELAKYQNVDAAKCVGTPVVCSYVFDSVNVAEAGSGIASVIKDSGTAIAWYKTGNGLASRATLDTALKGTKEVTGPLGYVVSKDLMNNVILKDILTVNEVKHDAVDITAQQAVDRGFIFGTAKDKAGAALAGVKVSLEAISAGGAHGLTLYYHGAKGATETDATGLFVAIPKDKESTPKSHAAYFKLEKTGHTFPAATTVLGGSVPGSIYVLMGQAQ